MSDTDKQPEPLTDFRMRFGASLANHLRATRAMLRLRDEPPPQELISDVIQGPCLICGAPASAHHPIHHRYVTNDNTGE